jgi:hypothetical protein
MKTLEITTKSRGTLKVEIPSNVDDWQLYHGVKGASQAASALTAALSRAMKAMLKDGSLCADKAVCDIVCPVCSKFASQGASDSEPIHTAEHFLGTFVRQLRGDDSF